MNSQELNEIIAIHRGYRKNPHYQNYGMENRHAWINPKGQPHGQWESYGVAPGWKDYPLPGYVSDLNVWHRLEKDLLAAGLAGARDDARYAKALKKVMGFQPEWNASALQKATAYYEEFIKA